MYLKDVVDNSKNIIVAKVVNLQAKGANISRAEVQTLEVLKGTASSTLFFKPDRLWIYNRKNISNGEVLILLFDHEHKNKFIKGFIRLNSFIEEGIRKSELLYWITYPARIQKEISLNDSISKIQYVQTKERIYEYPSVPFDTLLQLIKSLINEPARIKIRHNAKFDISPNRDMLEVYMNNHHWTSADSLGLFDGKYVPGVKKSVVLFNLGEPAKTLDENGITILRYKKIYKKDFMFTNDSLVEMNQIPSEKRH